MVRHEKSDNLDSARILLFDNEHFWLVLLLRNKGCKV